MRAFGSVPYLESRADERINGTLSIEVPTYYPKLEVGRLLPHNTRNMSKITLETAVYAYEDSETMLYLIRRVI
jgi:hypothetical protein